MKDKRRLDQLKINKWKLNLILGKIGYTLILQIIFINLFNNNKLNNNKIKYDFQNRKSRNKERVRKVRHLRFRKNNLVSFLRIK